MAENWVPPELDADLKALSDQLESEFHVEQALLPSGLTDRILHAMPQPASSLLRFARALTAVVLVAALGCLALAAVIYLGNGHTSFELLRLVFGLGVTVLAVTLSVSAPRLVLWDAQLTNRLTGRFKVPEARDLILVRAASLILICCGAVAMFV